MKSQETANAQLFQTAQLLLSLYELRREPKRREARQWFLPSFRPKTPADFFLLCPPGSETETLDASSINDAGEIVGFGVTTSGDVNGFLATPCDRSDDGMHDQ